MQKNCWTSRNATRMLLSFCFLSMLACETETPASEATKEQRPLYRQPTYFPPSTYDFSNTAVSEAGFQLGKKLFYDGRLSRNGTIACANCHLQASAFTQHGHDLSHGIDDKLGRRNALPIQNVAFKKSFFWDGGVHDLDLFALSPIENPVEMDENINRVLEKLRADAAYRKDFKKVFGTDEITTVQFLKALGQFQAALISDNAKYDQYLRGEIALSAEEAAGMAVFNQKCGSCHSGALLTDESYRDNGLEIYYRSTDFGRYNITLQETDRHKFKVPSLRNVELTFPYMHDGRFRTLEAVLEHYASGVQDNPTLDPVLKQSNTLGISLTNTEKSDIIAFLKTLTDRDFITDKRFYQEVSVN